MVRVSFAELQGRVDGVLRGLGLTPARAALGARLIAETDRDGVRTHGLARLPRFAEMVRSGVVAVDREPERVAAFGALERWTGRRGPGNLAAEAMTRRAMQLAREHGIGAVALGDTNHWQRGGTYGWQAAEAGCALLAWTNTMPNLPPWGGTRAALGNNPLVVAVPRRDGETPAAVVLDMAMSQFSYGALASASARGEPLPVPGGYDEEGELTNDPATIERTQRALPIGFWKGSGLSFVLDVLAAMLSGGKATHEIRADPLQETGLSQVFMAIHPEAVSSLAEMDRVVTGCIDFLHAADPVRPGLRPRYPGEGTMAARAESERLGVGIEESVWTAFERLEAAP